MKTTFIATVLTIKKIGKNYKLGILTAMLDYNTVIKNSGYDHECINKWVEQQIRISLSL